MQQSFRSLFLQRLKYFKERAWSGFQLSLGCSWAMLREEGRPAVARILQRPCSDCEKFHKYGWTRNWGRGTKIFGTWSTAHEYGVKRCPILLQCGSLNINISITDLVFFNITYVKKLNKVNRSVSSRGLCDFFFLCVCICFFSGGFFFFFSSSMGECSMAQR